MEERERKIQERAHRIWEEAGRPEGRAEEQWQAAVREVDAEEGQGVTPDDAQTTSHGAPPADPVRNPVPHPPASDPMYPAVTGPEQVPDIEGATEGLNPGEIVKPKRAKRPTSKTASPAAGKTEVKVRRRPGNTTPKA